MANSASDLFRLVSQTDLRQDVLLTRLSEYLSKSSADNTRLQLDKLEEINKTLRLFLEEAALNQPTAREGYIKTGEMTDQAAERLQEQNEKVSSPHRHDSLLSGGIDDESYANKEAKSPPPTDNESNE